MGKLAHATDQYQVAMYLRSTGLTYAEIGKRLGVSRQRAQQIVTSGGPAVASGHMAGRPHLFDPSEVARLCERYRAGESSEELARECGVSLNTVISALRRGGASDAIEATRARQLTAARAERWNKYRANNAK